MTIVYLAAGFGTRLQEFGQRLPKGLIPYSGTTLLDRLMADTYDLCEKKILVTNEKFFPVYTQWRAEHEAYGSLEIFSDGVETAAAHIGALGDIVAVFDHFDLWGSDVLVLSTDTYYQFAMADFVTFAAHTHAFATVVRDMGSPEPIRGRLGCATVNDDRIVAFAEKPDVPESTFAAIPFYWYAQEMHEQLRAYKDQGEDMDAPGRIIPWLLAHQSHVYAYATKAETIDVGTIADVEKLQTM